MRNPAVRLSLRRRPHLGRWVPFAVLAVACALTLAVVVNVAGREYVTAQTAFESDTVEALRAVQTHFDTVTAVSRAASALLAARPEINYTEFRAFVGGLQLRERYPGLDGLGFAPLVRSERLRAFTRDVVLDGTSNFEVRPQGQRDQYFPTILLEPDDARNRALLGFDLGSEPGQRAAMERARDSGAAAMGDILGPMSTGSASRRLVLYLPVYRSGAVLSSLEGRRNALVGFVFAPFRPDVLLRESLMVPSRSLAVDVYDAPDTRSTLLYESPARERAPRFRYNVPFRIGGRDWRLVATSRGTEDSLLPPEAQRILATGMLLSLLLFALMRAQVRARETSDRHAAELQATDRAKDEFLAVLSHELRTPLNVLLGWLSMLRSGAVRDERRGHALDVIDRNARAQAQLIEDLLDVSRILMGKMRLDKRALALVPAVGSAIDSLRPSADAKGVSLRGPDLALDQSLFIAADAARFEQIVTNLVWNALKFTPPGGAVWVNVAAKDGVAQVSVCDTGEGIPPEFLPHVFDRFRQADSSTTRIHQGMGMGLAIVRDLVQLHGGSVEAQSKGRSQGATFVVTFPLVPAQAGADRSSLVLAEVSSH